MYDEGFPEAITRLKQEGKQFAIATVIKTEGSSVAKPGFKALVQGDHIIHGNMGGSCPESVIIEESEKVIKTGTPKIFTVHMEKEKLRFEIGTIVKSVSLLDNNSVNTPRVPQINSESYVLVEKSELERGLKAAEDVSDAIRLTMSPDDFRAKSSSDSEESEMILHKDMLKEIRCTGTIKSSYPLEYLLKFVKSLSTSDVLKLGFKDDYPLTIEFQFGQNRNKPEESMKGSFLLAPRMEQ